MTDDERLCDALNEIAKKQIRVLNPDGSDMGINVAAAARNRLDALLRELATAQQQLAECHDLSCENGHAKHDDCTDACSCVGSGKSKVERLQVRIDELLEELEKVKHGASRFRCEVHQTDASFAWGCPECVRELCEERVRLRDALVKLVEAADAEFRRSERLTGTYGPPGSKYLALPYQAAVDNAKAALNEVA